MSDPPSGTTGSHGRPLPRRTIITWELLPGLQASNCRSRKLLLADITFNTVKNLQSRKGMFLDPSTSPARYPKTLFIDCPHVIPAADAEEGGCIQAFSQVVRLEVECGTIRPGDLAVSLVAFHAYIMHSRHQNPACWFPPFHPRRFSTS